MQGDSRQDVLRRMAGIAEAEGGKSVPETPARTLRLAMARAALKAVRLPLTVTTVADDHAHLDALLTRFDEAHLHVALTDGGRPVGYLVFDHELRAALVEVQMTGRVAARPAGDRPVTGADAALCGGLFTALAEDLCQPDRPGHFGPWVSGLTPGGRLHGPRAVSLTLPDGAYRILSFGIDLGVGERTGRLTLVLPDRSTAKPKALPPAKADWGTALSMAVRAAPADLGAILYRARLTLREVAAFAPGQVLPLHGVTLDMVLIEGPGREVVGHGRLGQVTGMRAVRLAAPGSTPRRLARAPGAAGSRSYGTGDLQLPASTDLRASGSMEADPSPDAAPGSDDGADDGGVQEAAFDQAPILDEVPDQDATAPGLPGDPDSYADHPSREHALVEDRD